MNGDLVVELAQNGPIPLAVELRCAPGQVLALVGPSGSGKSTVLRSIAGLYRPGRGRVSCAGQTWLATDRNLSLPPQVRRVGMVFQSYALMPHLNALDNIRLGLSGPAHRQRARELLARVHLEGLEDRRPGELSGGQQQRVALARALARDPQVLLLDEPFSAVDQVTRRKLRLELAALTRTLQIPILLVTHDLDEAAMLGDRLCVIHAGHTLQSGLPQQVLRHPETATVARLMDVGNLFEGQVLEHREGPNITRLAWAGRILEARLDRRFAPGERVNWLIPGDSVLLHQRRRPSRGERENPVYGRVIELLTLGGLTTVLIRLQDPARLTLTLELPPHVARRNYLKIGEEVAVSLVAEAIHLMPWQP
ncbi:MAG: ABC transporter ATP-binding protein, partial [Candidatus Competibacteraceae bacterium]|nr:ABC transporter ATP-binding protein [Candidatus Competibacteraceae bacterium]